MRFKVFRLALFLAANFLLALWHIHLFQGPAPFSAWLSLSLHGLLLLFFPYKRAFF